MVELLFQPTVGRFVNLDPFLPGFLHLFFNSLHTQEQEGQEQMVRDGGRKREREVLIWEMLVIVKIADHRNRMTDVKLSFLAYLSVV